MSELKVDGVVASTGTNTNLTLEGKGTGGVKISDYLVQAKGADISSATSLTLGKDGNQFDVTGTTTITSIATQGIGSYVILQFDGALTFTHHATDLILPGAANITTAAGDIAEMYEYASGDWRCVSYTKASGKPITFQQTKGADISSATSLTLGTDGNLFDVTGTTTITSIATQGIGSYVTLHFDGALTFTHHSTNLILPGAANITTAAGDIAVMYEYASADWRCVSYTKASGAGIVAGGAMTLLSTVTASNAATADFTSSIDSTYDVYMIVGSQIIPGTDIRFLWCRLGDGSGFDSGGSDYSWIVTAHGGDGGGGADIQADGSHAASSEIEMTGEITVGAGSAAGEASGFVMYLFDPSDTSNFTTVGGSVHLSHSSSSGQVISNFTGTRITAGAMDRIQFLFSAGNINGVFRLYGLNNS